MNSGPFDNQKQIYHLNTILVRYSDGYCTEHLATGLVYNIGIILLQLHKIYNRTIDNDDWMDMNNQQNFNNRNNDVHITENSRLKIGRNLMINRLKILNGQINYDWLNESLNLFKISCKAIFLNNLAKKCNHVTICK